MGKQSIRVQTYRVQTYGARGGYSKVIGKAIGRDGNAKPKVWYFLHCSESEAIRRAAWLKAEWIRLSKGLGHDVWPSDFELPWAAQEPAATEPTPWIPSTSSHAPTALLAAAKGKASSRSVKSDFRSVKVGAVSLKDAFDLYRAAKESDLEQGKISHGRLTNLKNFLKPTLEHLGESTPLASIREAELEGLVALYRSRPNAKGKGEPISMAYAESLIGISATFFRWVASKPLGWSLPQGFEELFDLKKKPLKPKSEAERKANRLAKRDGGIKTLDIPTLRKLYKAADETMRAWILLGLNAAFTQIDVSDLRTYDLIEKDGRKYIDTEREKTKQDCKCLLWAETVKAIEATKSKPNAEERVWLSPHGNELVSREKRSDYVSRQWSALAEKVGLKDCPSFKHLRKTSATMILQLSGERAIQEAHTAHSEGFKMAEHYANRFWDDVHTWQDKMRESFKAVWAD